MIGIFEIIFCLIAFCIMWFLIFYVKLRYDKKKALTNLASNLEKQEGKEFLVEGRVISLGKKKVEKKKIEDKKPIKKSIVKKK